VVLVVLMWLVCVSLPHVASRDVRLGGIGLERTNAASMSFGPVLTVPA
jgi:hypothetical protein